MVEKMFENATRRGYRFPFKGMIDVEDLWRLSPESLDGVFKTLNSEIKTVKEESLLDIPTEADKVLSEKIAIVKYIVKTKLAEQRSRLEAVALKEREQKLLRILDSKKDAALEDMSEEELEAEIAKLRK